jgi:hypothetical protein
MNTNTLNLMTRIALVAVFAMGLILVPAFNSTGTVSAQKGRNRAEVATQDMLYYALNLKSVSGDAVYADKGISDTGNSKIANGYSANGAQKDSRNRIDLANSFSAINQLPCNEISDTNLTEKTFGAGVYCLASAELAGRVIFDANNDSGAIFVIRVAGSLKTAKGSFVSLVGDAQAANVFFVAGDEATIGEGSDIKGNIIARNNIGIGADASVDGRALSVKGEVDLSGNSILGPQQTGVLEVCKAIDTTLPGSTTPGTSTGLLDRTFNFTAAGVNFEVAAGQCSGPITVPSGPITVQELSTGRVISTGASVPASIANNFQLTRVRTLGATPTTALTAVNFQTRTASVNIRAGDTSNQTRLEFTNRFAITGVLEICKEALDSGVTGFFQFVINEVRNSDGTVVGGSVGPFDGSLPIFNVPVGQCSGPINVTVGSTITSGPPRNGIVTVAELQRTGYLFTSATTAVGTVAPANRLVGFTPTPSNPTFLGFPIAGYVQAVVVEGGTAVQTTVFVNNRSVPAALKICKIAGPGVPELTPFTFTVNGFVALPAVGTPPVVPIGSQASGPIAVTVLAGPAPGGFCQIVGAPGVTDGIRFIVDSSAIVTENGPTTIAGVFGEIRVARITSTSGIISAGNPATGAVGGPTTATAPFGTPGQPAIGTSPFAPFSGTNGRAPGVPLYTGATGAIRSVNVPIIREVAEVEFVNFAFLPVPLKVCKVAGTGVAQGTPFTFTISNDTAGGLLSATPTTTTLTVLAGPAGTGPGTQNGYCDFAAGPFSGTYLGTANGALVNLLPSFNYNSTVTVTETVFGTTVINAGGITSPTGGVIANTTNRTGVMTLIANVNEIAFVNTVAPAQPVKSRKRARFF